MIRVGTQRDVGQTLPVAKKSWSFYIDAAASAFAYRGASTSTLTRRLLSNKRRLSGCLVWLFSCTYERSMQTEWMVCGNDAQEISLTVPSLIQL